jgi:hypothetical protein
MAIMESKSLIGLVNRIQNAMGVADSLTGIANSRPSVVAQGLRPCP